MTGTGESKDYRVKLKQKGPGGQVFYEESDGTLPFRWAIHSRTGIGIFVPAQHEWDEYCDKHGAEWAKGRREEIVDRTARKLIKQRYGKGTYEVGEDNWVHLIPGPGLFSRLIDFFG